jgi:hypothetical protein
MTGCQWLADSHSWGLIIQRTGSCPHSDPKCEDGDVSEGAVAVVELQSSCLEGLVSKKGPTVRVNAITEGPETSERSALRSPRSRPTRQLRRDVAT